MELDSNRLAPELSAQLNTLGEEFVQAVLLDVQYLIVMLREGGKQANRRADQADAHRTGGGDMERPLEGART